ncbi:MAG: calcium-translocating P-type ATPase, PMCA-type [Candidatus Hodarchaeota archaeon]
MKYSYRGLSSKEVEESRKLHGSNELTPPERETFWDKFIGNFKDPIILILVIALVITIVLMAFGHAKWYESFGIAVAVLIATFVATWSEYKNETSFQKLQEEAFQIDVNVFRDSHIQPIRIGEIVIGDHVLLQSGDKVPADGRIIHGDLKVNQAALSGEADHVEKILAPADYKSEKIEDLSNPYVLYRGSVVEEGEAILLVDKVGDQTVYGKIAMDIKEEERDSPLQVKLSNLGDGISKFGYIGGTFIALSFLFKKIIMDHNYNFQEIGSYITQNFGNFLHDVVSAVILAIIIIVVAVPEGLPMMIAFVLSLNMRKLLNNKVLVRKLLGIETAGSLNVLFCDKTGTITKGEMEATLFMNGDNQSYTKFESIPRKLKSLLTLSLRENTECVIDYTADGREIAVCGGNRVERALLKFIDIALLEETTYSIHSQIQFSSATKYSATRISGDKEITLIKGAPEVVLSNCQYYYNDKGEIQKIENLEALNKEIDILSQRAMRVIAIATSDKIIEKNNITLIPKVLVGIIGIRDELRPEAVPAIKQAQAAGIQVVMITGDKRETAVAIAKDSGLLEDENSIVLTSSELSQMTDKELIKIFPNLRVVARALPTDKSRLVSIAKNLGLVAGMTGDGVNDSAALKMADVGFAMGSGTEVAKEAGDVVIMDDNFKSISKAILYGRTIFRSIRKFIVFQLTVNVSAILVAFLGPFLGYDFPLTMVQLLWVNLVMDTLAAAAFGGEAALERYMNEKPVPRDASILNTDMRSAILIGGCSIAFLCILFLKLPSIGKLFRDNPNIPDLQKSFPFMTAFFAFFIFLNNFNKFNARTESMNLFDAIFQNKGFLFIVTLIFSVQIIFTYFGGQDILRTVGLTLGEWRWVVLMSILIIPIDLSRKLVRNIINNRK